MLSEQKCRNPCQAFENEFWGNLSCSQKWHPSPGFAFFNTTVFKPQIVRTQHRPLVQRKAAAMSQGLPGCSGTPFYLNQKPREGCASVLSGLETSVGSCGLTSDPSEGSNRQSYHQHIYMESSK